MKNVINPTYYSMEAALICVGQSTCLRGLTPGSLNL